MTVLEPRSEQHEKLGSAAGRIERNLPGKLGIGSTDWVLQPEYARGDCIEKYCQTPIVKRPALIQGEQTL